MAAGDPTGADLCSGTTDGDTLGITFPPNYTQREITFGVPVELTSGVKYAIVVRALTGDATNYVSWRPQLGAGTYDGGNWVSTSDGGTSWTQQTSYDLWFTTKASGVAKDVHNPANAGGFGAYGNIWVCQTFTASSTYTISSVILLLARKNTPGTVTVSIRATEGPGKATTPTPTDDQENLEIIGKDRLLDLSWVAPAGETPDYLIYYRASGGAWVLQETITDDSTSHTLSQTVLDAFSYYSIYEWRVDTRESGVTTTGDTWTFITQISSQFTDYTRRSDYDADKVWQPGTGWVDINTFAYTGGGSFKGRVLVVGHKVIYFGDI